MSFQGMDPDQVRDQAEGLRTAAERLGEVLDRLDAATHAVEWRGPDADSFRENWHVVRSQGESVVVPGIRDRSGELERHAEEQDKASSNGDSGGGFWDGVVDFFSGAAEKISDFASGVAGVVDWVADEIGEQIAGWPDDLRDYPGILLGNLQELGRSTTGLLGMAADAVMNGEWPRLTELGVGLIDAGLDGINTLVHATTGLDLNLADDGTGYADAPQQVELGGPGDPGYVDPHSLADIINNTNASYGAPEDGQVGLTVVRDAQGNPTGVIANIPGTEQWSPFASDNPMDLSGNAAQAGPNGWSAGSEATADAIAQLYSDLDLPPGTPLMLNGHSQGGMIASSLAGDPDFSNQFNVTNVMTYGSPVQNYPVNSGTDYLHIQHGNDLVPKIDAGGRDIFLNPPVVSPNVTTVTADSPGGIFSPGDNHSSGEYHTTVTEQLAQNGSQLHQYQHSGSVADFLVGDTGYADHYVSDVHRNN
ncbi:PGAP1-like alpha/beta domain-containing protein [Brachybacterium muris]|uniref:GPI inositol-deacylase PGAP1-like alpha/beta domain-containing protein n=1 Tax=Brachybacterium muris UCD-AY4 TaxID=1249481 RepID=A0A022KT58_9MICO|nr:hypothetical protein [Brachybacterium muris]EYT48984.1 hypothetical protein D641_0110140 [Brachybacterium muris UCD-AY4]